MGDKAGAFFFFSLFIWFCITFFFQFFFIMFFFKTGIAFLVKRMADVTAARKCISRQMIFVLFFFFLFFFLNMDSVSEIISPET